MCTASRKNNQKLGVPTTPIKVFHTELNHAHSHSFIHHSINTQKAARVDKINILPSLTCMSMKCFHLNLHVLISAAQTHYYYFFRLLFSQFATVCLFEPSAHIKKNKQKHLHVIWHVRKHACHTFFAVPQKCLPSSEVCHAGTEFQEVDDFCGWEMAFWLFGVHFLFPVFFPSDPNPSNVSTATRHNKLVTWLFLKKQYWIHAGRF